jgi:D-alanyl-D-alanine carboxypeptidase
MALDGDKRGSARSPTRRTLLVALALLVPVAVIIADVAFMLRGRAREGGTTAPPASLGGSSGGSVRAVAKSTVEFPSTDDEVTPDLDAALAAPSASDTPVDDDTAMDDDGAPEEPGSAAPAKPAAPQHFATVQDAAVGSCSTVSIEGLSKQIIEQARCMNPKAVVPLPTRPNLVTGPYVFPYLQAEARDRLVRVLDAHKNATMKINSALRTVAQQYLVWRWSASKSCGVELATRPGESNHELGLALDVAEHASWRAALEAEQFHWLGASDRVHFDYKAPDAQPRKMMDVLAFQKLWNRNHPKDLVGEDGLYSPATELRLKKAPADGFELGPTCGKSAKRPP